MSRPAEVRTWLVEPMARDVAEAIERLRRAPSVEHVAEMPDVHLASDVCVGVAMATTDLIYPQAVGGDIGCGMLAVALDARSDALGSGRTAGLVLAGLAQAVPALRRKRSAAIEQPAGMLSDAGLERVRRAVGTLEFATLGSGNHFLEIQVDEDERLWLMVHSGSRALGPAIRDYHLARGEPAGGGLRALDARSDAGAAYLHDAGIARWWADASRRAIAEEAGRVLEGAIGARICWETAIRTDHNHVAREVCGDRELWVHRKGAMRAGAGQAGVLPGSMGSTSFHVEVAAWRRRCFRARMGRGGR